MPPGSRRQRIRRRWLRSRQLSCHHRLKWGGGARPAAGNGKERCDNGDKNEPADSGGAMERWAKAPSLAPKKVLLICNAAAQEIWECQ